MAKKRPSSSTGPETPDDPLSRWITATSRWIRENTQMALVVGVLFAVGVGAGIYYFNFQQDVQLQAAEEFERIQQTTVGVGDTQTAITELGTFLQRYGDTPLGAEARLLLAEAHLREGAPEQAIEVLAPELGNLNEPIEIQSAFLLAAAYEEADRDQEAEESYLEIAQESELTFQVRDALASAARIRSSAGDPAGAAELYRQVLETFDDSGEDQAPDAGQRDTYELRLAEAEARARDS